MELTPQNIELIRLTATEVSRQIVEKVVAGVIKTHLDTCPYGKTLLKTKLILVGFCIGSGIGGGIAGGGIAVTLMKAFLG